MTKNSILIRIRGEVLNKKDSLRPKNPFARNRGKGMTYDQETATAIDRITLQIRAQWGAKPPLRHPDISVQFTFPHRRRDRDGRLATLLDCLKVAGVIRDDSVAHLNGLITILPAVVDKDQEEGAVVFIEPESQRTSRAMPAGSSSPPS